jgi:8-oxo-dGTP pyrophosphatase MutT (NUDIX family)
LSAASDQAPPPFRKVGEEQIYEGHVISLGVGTFEGPDGEAFSRDVVHHPGAVSVVPLLDDGRVVLVRQYRAALDTWLLEIPAGKRDVPGEAPEVTAGRELAEEVGYVAADLELLAQFHNSAGFSDERSFVYLGTGLTATATDLQGVEEEHMTIEIVSLDAVPEMIRHAELTDAKTIIGLTLTLRRLGR